MKDNSEKQSKEDPSWWAAVNVALFTHRLRAIEKLIAKKENQQAWDYLPNVLKVISELTLGKSNLLDIQALLGIATVL